MAARKAAGSSANLPANIDAELAKEAATVGETLNSSGGSFIRVDQKTGNFKHSVLGEAPPPQDFVVVDYRAQNKFYSKGYVEGEAVPPDCWAIAKKIDDLRPSDTVPDPENEQCKGCPMNEFGSAHNGKGKACKNTYMVALLPADDPSAEIAYMSVSPTGLKSFEAFVNGCSARYNLPPIGAIVTISTKPAGSGYTVDFGAHVKNPKYKEHYQRRQEAVAMLEREWTPEEPGNAPAKAPARRAPRKRR